MPVTVEGNVASLLRFLGWANRHCAVSGSPDMRIFKLQGCRDLLDEYVSWLVRDRQISYGSIANYVNSLMNAMAFVADQLMNDEEVPPHMEELFSAAFNLRSQSEAQAREDRMYRPRSEQYMTWSECQQTRETCRIAYESTLADPKASREDKIRATSEMVLLCFLTILPPDRRTRTPSLVNPDAPRP